MNLLGRRYGSRRSWGQSLRKVIPKNAHSFFAERLQLSSHRLCGERNKSRTGGEVMNIFMRALYFGSQLGNFLLERGACFMQLGSKRLGLRRDSLQSRTIGRHFVGHALRLIGSALNVLLISFGLDR